ncbi:MAG TPA: methionine synthase [Ignavibacteria bacterium]|nr:methionine synthase [Ignavibacteria bacterium]
MKEKLILGAALGSCVHIGGLHHFLKLAESEGFRTVSLGPAVPVDRFAEEIIKQKPLVAAVSYRLTPEVAALLFEDLKKKIKENKLNKIKFIFGGTPPAAEAAKRSGLFEKVFSGTESIREIKAYLRGSDNKADDVSQENSLIGRINKKYPYPLLRHHFGRPNVEETIQGAKEIAEAEVLDVLSLGTDQNAQEFFFNQSEMNPAMDGAGGVPVRKPEHLKAIYEASRCGNFPLMRCYSGTNDLLQWAEMSVETINNAWAAIPLCWYSVIDGRSERSLYDAITENRNVMKWYADKNIPVEVNESHQWSLRDAHDSLAVVMSYLAAYNAKKMGVKSYVSQFMFNTPPGTYPVMDIAKMTAKRTLLESLEDGDFKVYREVRAGIAHFFPVPAIAKGQLAASIAMSLALEPHILHVVGFSEGDHATYPGELIESCNIAHGVLHNCLDGLPDMKNDPAVKNRRDELLEEAAILLEALNTFGGNVSEDPHGDANVIAKAIKYGLLDAPHFRGNVHLCGEITTSLIEGAWYAVEENTGRIIKEKERTDKILNEKGKL